MAYAFLIEKVHSVAPPSGIAKQGTTFDMNVTLDGQKFIFRFSWNGYNQFYSIDIFRDNGERIKKWYPSLDDEIVIRNWNPDSASRGDAELRLVDIKNEDRTILPSRLGTAHSIIIMLGRVKSL